MTFSLRPAMPVIALLALLAPVMMFTSPGVPPKIAEQAAPNAIPGTAAASLGARYGRVPLAFERNQGQTDDAVRFFSRGPGYSLFLTPDEAVLRVHPMSGRHAMRPGHPAPPAVVRMTLTDARRDAQIEGLEPQAGKSHYFRGNDPAHWQQDVAHYGKVRYRAVYPGVDVVYYGNQQQLEYDFVLAPGADPVQIGMRFEGPQAVRLDGAGNLVLPTPQGNLLQHKPIAYQDIAGQRRSVSAEYRLLAGHQVGFALGDYDRTQPLVIDPVLSYSSYLGGGLMDMYPSLAVDASGNTYVLGMTDSPDFPTAAPFQATTHTGALELFVSKLSASGDALIYSTFLGGGASETAGGITVDQMGNAYLTGCSDSTDFPLQSPLQSTGGSAVVAKLNASGNALVYSTYLGASRDCGNAIAVDSSGAVYVAGITEGGMSFPPGSFQPNYGGGMKDAFVVKLNAAGSALVFGTYLGGSDDDYGWGLALDSFGNTYVTGGTYSLDFPTVNAMSPQAGGNGYTDGFVSKLNANGTALVYSTYLGGGNIDYGTEIAVDQTGNAYVVGATYGDFPTKNPLQPWTGGADGFVCKLNASGQALIYSTYLGGSLDELAPSIALDSNGNAYITGWTASINFPTASPWQADSGNAGGLTLDAYVTKINATGTDLAWSSYLVGIPRKDRGMDIALDVSGRVHVTGDAGPNFPTLNAIQPAFGGGHDDAFIVRITGTTPTSLRYRHNDANDDGRADILWRNTSTAENVLWSAANYDIQRPVARVGLDWVVAATGDFNGDHKADLLWRNHKTGANFIWRSTFQSSGQGVTGVNNLAWIVAGVGDFDGDGKSDILWRNSSTGANTIWKAADAATQQAVTGVTNQIWKIVGVGDFNGDGKADILWRNSSTGANTIWKSANSTTQQGVAGIASQDWKVFGVGDFDGDGKSDILWRNTVTGAHMIWKSANASTQQAVTSVTNQIWKIAGVADFNGDGKSDILWRNSSTGANTIWKSANSTTQQGVTGVTDQAWTIVP
ncbi:SBBP repeat-containing protein [Lysobacter sp. CFH 32150]|uniref:DUF7948 domain-containing protein n=1 Tax=Lysobacter sp. CFH 32150 TaxID=2927128 RepID=UPI001FA6DA81|nr:SBBP repeat-containing protein [Lysobacter sp. CFH 32150]MCI4567960.1 SBBP repeat-containing protein [Lysobacter sp. CFH 32150]